MTGARWSSTVRTDSAPGPSSRYERASLIVTSNKPFSAWGEIFGDEVVAAAMIDRLVHYAEIPSLKGKSYRLRERGQGVVLAAQAQRRETSDNRIATPNAPRETVLSSCKITQFKAAVERCGSPAARARSSAPQLTPSAWRRPSIPPLARSRTRLRPCLRGGYSGLPSGRPLRCPPSLHLCAPVPCNPPVCRELRRYRPADMRAG
jgi:hypothetical protein